MKDVVDYIVVGGGASGCAVTSKLLSKNQKVCLFEAGYSHDNFLLNIPSGFFKLLNNTKYATYHKTNPQNHLGGRQNIIPQGNVLGGGTSINAQVYMRGRAEDYNEWQEVLRGNNDTIGWGWNDVFPYFKEMENNINIDNEYHGNSGRMKVSNSSCVNELTYDFIDSVHKLGVPITNDFNAKEQKGVGLYQFMNSNGKRSSAAYAFIEPEKNNDNLILKLQTKVEKIIIENNIAIGVEYKNKNGEILKQYANKEVILASGSFITPKILMLSGIGDKEDLFKLDIKCKVALSGVGKNLIDHPECPLIATTNGKYGYFRQGEGWRMLKNGLQFLLFGTGPVNSTGVEAGAFINPINKNELAYIQAFFVPSIYMNSDTMGVIKDDFGMSITTVMTKPKSRGHVRLRSKNPNDMPIIELNLLKHEDDLKMMMAGQRFFLKSFQNGKLGSKVKEIILPNIKDLDDNKLATHCKKFVRTNYHPSGTAKMGADNDKMAVLDSKLRVRGIENLRVCDLSAMPNINSGNTAAPAIMLGLRCGDLLINTH